MWHNSVLNVKAVAATFNQEKAIVRASSVIVQLHRLIFTALVWSMGVGRYRALVNMWTKYGQEPHMSGVALQHQTYTVTGESNTNISSLVRWVLAYSSRGG